MFLINKDNFGTFSQKEMDILYKSKKLFYPESTIDFMNDNKNYRYLVLTDKVRREVENIIVPNEIRFDVLRSIPNRKDIIMIDENTVIKYKKTDEKICVLIFTLDPTKTYVHEECIEFNLIDNTTFPKMDEPKLLFYNDNDIRSDGNNEQYVLDKWSRFINVITFLELTQTVLLVVNGGEKKGDIMRGNYIKNETKSSVIQVNSNWNYKMIRVGSYKVRGHFRFQPCGKNFSQVKLIYIDMFEKGLMRRMSQKELQN